MKMQSDREMFYDPARSYEENYADGPFGLFSQLSKNELTIGQYNFFDIPIDIPFGIPAGPLLNSKFIEAAWRLGFSISTYKTVRGNAYPTHPFPNIIKVHSSAPDIRPGDVVAGELRVDSIDIRRDGITNSFGVPSKEPLVWQKDVQKALPHMKKGNVMILSFMGTKEEGMDRDEYIEDFAKTCREARVIGVPVLEVNFSCPNFGKDGLICNDVVTSRDILAALRNAKGNTPLLVKIGYFFPKEQDSLEALLDAIHENADGVVAINTIQAKVTDARGNQVLPGSSVRLFSGICGVKIRWAGLEMAERIVAYKKKKGWKDFIVVGVGGVVSVDDYWEYMKRGVDAVQSATGSMWKPDLANEIRSSVAKRK